MDSPYTSNLLWHFVGRAAPKDDERNYATLKKILDGRCISHPPHEHGQGKTGYTYNLKGTFRDESLIIPTVTCYADIPVTSLGIHVQKYGRFGVAFRRGLLVAKFARPVTYVPIRDVDGPMAGSSAYTLKDIEAVYRGFRKVFDARDDIPKTRAMTVEPANEGELFRGLKYVLELEVLAFIKAFHADLPQDHPNNYYMEREWRKYGNLVFELKDVAALCVALGHAETIKHDFPELRDKIIAVPPANGPTPAPESTAPPR